MIGELLGHRRVRTTARYAHLSMDTVKVSAGRVAESIASAILPDGVGPAAGGLGAGRNRLPFATTPPARCASGRVRNSVHSGKNHTVHRWQAKLRRRKLSNRTVEGITAENRDIVFWDSELLGFGVRVYPTGAKVYVVQTRAEWPVEAGHGGASRGHLRHPRPVAAPLSSFPVSRPERRIRVPPLGKADPWRSRLVTVAELADRFLREYVADPLQAVDDDHLPWVRSTCWIVPVLGRMQVGAVDPRARRERCTTGSATFPTGPTRWSRS